MKILYKDYKEDFLILQKENGIFCFIDPSIRRVRSYWQEVYNQNTFENWFVDFYYNYWGKDIEIMLNNFRDSDFYKKLLPQQQISRCQKPYFDNNFRINDTVYLIHNNEIVNGVIMQITLTQNYDLIYEINVMGIKVSVLENGVFESYEEAEEAKKNFDYKIKEEKDNEEIEEIYDYD